MAEHVRRPAGRRAVDGVDLPDRAAGDDRLHLLVVLAVAVLMADDRLHAGLVERLLDRQPFGARHRDRLLERDQLRADFDADLDERQPHVRRRAEAEDVRLHLRGQRARHRCSSSRRRASPPRRPAASGSLLLMPDQLEARIGGERRGMVHAALAHARRRRRDRRIITSPPCPTRGLWRRRSPLRRRSAPDTSAG